MSEPKTFGMKLSELRGCDHCGRKISPFFLHIQIRRAVFNAQNLNGVLGLMQMWGNQPRSFAIAEAMAPGADDVVEVLDESQSTTTLFICNACFLKDINLALIEEKRGNAIQLGDKT